MSPKISVIVPVYNSERYLKECLESILVQTFDAWELIAVDDGSKDSSPKILDEFASKDERIRVIHILNGGVSNARNTGLEEASGDYVFFADSDDWLDPDALKMLYENCASTGADIVIGDYWAYKEESTKKTEEKRYKFFSRPFLTEDRKILSQLQLMTLYRSYSPYYSSEAGYMFGAQWTKLIRRELLITHQVRFTRSISLFEDGIFGIETLQFARKVCYIRKPIYHYRLVASSLCHSHDLASIDLYRNISKELEQISERYHKDDVFKEACETRTLYHAKKQVGHLFSNQIGFFEKYTEMKKILKHPFYAAIIRNVPHFKLIKNEKIFGKLAYRKCYLLLSLMMQMRRG